MATVEDRLEGTVLWLQESLEHDCGACAGTGGQYTPEPGVCPHCDKGRVRYGRYAPQVQHGVNNAGVAGMYQCREEGDFDRMNRLLDWLYAYNMQVAAAVLQDMSPEAAQTMGESLQRADATIKGHRHEPVKFTPSPIPPDELDALIREHDAEQAAKDG